MRGEWGCPNCGKILASKASLNRHMDSPTSCSDEIARKKSDEQPHESVPRSDRDLRRSAVLDRRPCKCDKCGVWIRERRFLAEHQQSPGCLVSVTDPNLLESNQKLLESNRKLLLTLK